MSKPDEDGWFIVTNCVNPEENPREVHKEVQWGHVEIAGERYMVTDIIEDPEGAYAVLEKPSLGIFDPI